MAIFKLSNRWQDSKGFLNKSRAASDKGPSEKFGETKSNDLDFFRGIKLSFEFRRPRKLGPSNRYSLRAESWPNLLRPPRTKLSLHPKSISKLMNFTSNLICCSCSESKFHSPFIRAPFNFKQLLTLYSSSNVGSELIGNTQSIQKLL